MSKRINKLSIRNFLGIETLEIVPGKVNIIGGPNGAGKTSILKAIAEAIGGGGKRPNLIHLGEDKAEIMLDLGEVEISRRITASGNYVDVTHELVGGGRAKVLSPQSYLDALVGPLSFNPVAFFAASARERREMLLAIIPCQVTTEQVAEWFGPEVAAQVDCRRHGLEVLADCERLLVEQRREANAQHKAAESRTRDLQGRIPGEFDETHWRQVEVSALSETIRAAGESQAEHTALERGVATAEYELEIAQGKLAGLRTEIERLQASLATGEQALADQEQTLQAQRMYLAAHVVPDIAAELAELAAYTEAQGTLKLVDELDGALEDRLAKERRALTLDAQVDLARQKPTELLAASELPIAGLEITADAIRLNGVLVEDLSTSEQLRFALAVARALSNADLPVILIDGVECLDPEHFDVLLTEMQDDEYQYFVTGVMFTEDGALEIATMAGEPAWSPRRARVEGVSRVEGMTLDAALAAPEEAAG